jgi:hypothetical protein
MHGQAKGQLFFLRRTLVVCRDDSGARNLGAMDVRLKDEEHKEQPVEVENTGGLFFLLLVVGFLRPAAALLTISVNMYFDKHQEKAARSLALLGGSVPPSPRPSVRYGVRVCERPF